MSAEHGKTADIPTTYRKAYDRGWAASMHGAGEVGADGKTALERADDRGEVAAWYDGYNDHAVDGVKWATYWNDHAPDTTADNTAPALPHGVSIAPLADGVECVCDSCGEIREFTGASAESDAAAWAHAAHGTCAVDCAPFKVGASVGFVAGAWRGFGDKRFTLDGMAGIVVESFAPNMGRNVRLDDGRIINAPTWELVTYADWITATNPDRPTSAPYVLAISRGFDGTLATTSTEAAQSLALELLCAGYDVTVNGRAVRVWDNGASQRVVWDTNEFRPAFAEEWDAALTSEIPS